jgi:hypothetical protein
MTPRTPEAITTFENLIAVQNIRGPISLGVGSISSDEGRINYRRFNIGDSLSEEFRNFIQKVIDSNRRDYKKHDVRLLSYDAGYKPESDEIEWIKYSDSPWLSSLLTQIPKPTNINIYDESEGDIAKDLRFYILFAKTPQGEDIHCFSFYSKMKELTKSNNILIHWVGDRFELLREPGFMFDERIDCILFKNYIFSFNKTNFHRIFRFYDQIRTLAGSSLTIIQQSIPIANFDEFQTACLGHPLKLAKLVNVVGKSYLSTITMADVRRTIEKNGLALEIVNERGVEKLRYDPRNQWMILNLIDDMYLDSELTHQSYEANSKRPIGN